jgi:hypothetical protein
MVIIPVSWKPEYRKLFCAFSLKENLSGVQSNPGIYAGNTVFMGVTGFRISEYTTDLVFIADPEISPVFSKKRKMPAPQNCRIIVFKPSMRIFPF